VIFYICLTETSHTFEI
jgi:SpoVK/Ycf46/Vps4 family AAA+-type ATPase